MKALISSRTGIDTPKPGANIALVLYYVRLTYSSQKSVLLLGIDPEIAMHEALYTLREGAGQAAVIAVTAGGL